MPEKAEKFKVTAQNLQIFSVNHEEKKLIPQENQVVHPTFSIFVALLHFKM